MIDPLPLPSQPLRTEDPAVGALPSPPAVAAPASPVAGAQTTLSDRQQSGFDPIGGLFGRRTGATGSTSSSSFIDTAREIFAPVDADGDGLLSHGELNAAMHDPDIKGAGAWALVAMSEHRLRLEELANDELGDENSGISRADLAAFLQLAAEDPLRHDVDGTLFTAQGQLNMVSRRLYPDGRDSIRAAGVNQGQTGDCYLLAALAGLAERHPDAIEQMITENGDGTYSVRFPGRPPISVTAPTDAEIARGAIGLGDGIWVTVIEKAYVTLRDSGQDYQAIDGGFGLQGIRVLTGGGESRRLGAPTARNAQELAETVSNALFAGQIATFSTPYRDKGHAEAGLQTNHVFTILNYNRGTGLFTVRDPGGLAGPNGDGTLYLTAAQILHYGNRLNISTL